MNINQSITNLSDVLLHGRITMPNGPLTSREHQQLAADLSLLAERAAKVDELQDKLAGNVELSNKLEIEVANLKGELLALREPIPGVLRIPEPPLEVTVPGVPDEKASVEG